MEETNMAEHKGFTRLKADLKAEQMQNVYIFTARRRISGPGICSRCGSC